MQHSWSARTDTVEVKPHPTARDQAVAKRNLPKGSSILAVPSFTSALLFSEKGHRCDHCFRFPKEGSYLKKCTGCTAYWYCDTQCQNAQWQLHHKRLCKKINQFTSSAAFQGLKEHDKMDAILLSHLLSYLSTLAEPYSAGQSEGLEIFLSLLPGSSSAVGPPPVPAVNPPPNQELVAALFERFGNNNFTVHSHLNSIGHGIFPLASRLFNHSCTPNAAAKYILSSSNTVTMHVFALSDIAAGEEICIPYVDPALTQTRHQIFQITYGFSCNCPSCKFLNSIGHVPTPPTDSDQLKDVAEKLRSFVQVDNYLQSDDYRSRPIKETPSQLHCVFHETFMKGLSERFSDASHESDFDTAADTGVTLLALYLLVYPINYPQIGMHLLEMAKTHWNHSFVLSDLPEEKKAHAKPEISRLLVLARRVLGVMGTEGDADGPLEEISILENLLRT